MPQALPAIGEEVAQSALPPVGSEMPAHLTPDFRADAEPPSKTFADQWASADTPEKRKALIAQTPVGQQVHHLMDLYVEHGPHAVVEGLKDLWHGDVAKGAHKVITGAGVTALPMVAAPFAEAALAAPGTTALVTGGAMAGGYAGQKVAQAGAEALGATPDQATLAGDLGGFVGGAGGAKLAFKASSAFDAARQAWQAQRRSAAGAATVSELRQAIPPSRSTPYTDGDLHRAMPYLDVQHAGEPIDGVTATVKAADTSIKQIEHHIGTAIAADPSLTIAVNPAKSVAAAVQGNPRAGFLDRGLAVLTKQYPQLAQGDLTLAEADRIRRALNADLDAMSAKNGYELATARETDPVFAAKEAVGKLLRSQIYGRLDAAGVSGIDELRRDEGALIAVRNAAQRQIYAGEKPVAGTAVSPTRTAIATGLRALPGNPLPAMATDAIASKIASSRVTRDDLIARAFARRVNAGAQATLSPLGTVPPAATQSLVQP